MLFLFPRKGSKVPDRYGPSDPSIADVVLEAFAVYLCLMAVLGTIGSHLPSHHPELSLLLVVPVLAALARARVRGAWGRRFFDAVGWNKGRGFAREMFAGIIGYIAGIPLVAVGMAIALALARLSSTRASHPVEFEITTGGWVRILLIFLACLFAPVTEELMFRGMFLRHLTRALAAPVVRRYRQPPLRRDPSPGLDGDPAVWGPSAWSWRSFESGAAASSRP